jgi:hypothetical protein
MRAFRPNIGGSRLAHPGIVLCRIQITSDADRVVIRLAGRLTEAQVPTLLQACGKPGPPPTLELDELMSADAVGMDALARIERQGGRLVGIPEYVRLELDALERASRG